MALSLVVRHFVTVCLQMLQTLTLGSQLVGSISHTFMSRLHIAEVRTTNFPFASGEFTKENAFWDSPIVHVVHMAYPV